MEQLTNKTAPKFDNISQHNGLTLHGAELINLMGRYFQGYLKKHSADLRKVDCVQLKNLISFFADPLADRCIETAKAFRKGFLDGLCSDEDSLDFLYPDVNIDASSSDVAFLLRDNPGKEREDMGCTLGSVEQVLGLIGGRTENLENIYRSHIEKVQKITNCCDPSVCAGKERRVLSSDSEEEEDEEDGDQEQEGEEEENDEQGEETEDNDVEKDSDNTSNQEEHPCTLLDIPFYWSEKNGRIDDVTPLNGNLGIVSYFAELFEMQYCNGIEAGWGTSWEDILQILAVRKIDNFVGVNMWTAQNMGSDLLLHILTQMEIAAGETVPDSTKKFQFYFGHHVNLQFIRKLLRLTWISKDWQMDSVEPGAMIVFELWNRGRQKIPTVRAFKVVATPNQQRFKLNLNSTNPPDFAPLSIPTCFQGEAIWCPLQRFHDIVMEAIRIECVGLKGNIKSDFSVTSQANETSYLMFWIFSIFILFSSIAFCIWYKLHFSKIFWYTRIGEEEFF